MLTEPEISISKICIRNSSSRWKQVCFNR